MWSLRGGDAFVVDTGRGHRISLGRGRLRHRWWCPCVFTKTQAPCSSHPRPPLTCTLDFAFGRSPQLPTLNGSWRGGAAKSWSPDQISNPSPCRLAWRGRAGKRAVYTYPSKKALASVVDKVRSLTRRAKHRTLADLLRRLNPTLRGWCNYFRHGVSSRTFSYVDHFAFWRIVGWLRKRHVGLNWETLHRRFLPGWKVRDGRVEMFRPQEMAIVRYRFRGTNVPTPWPSSATGSPAPAR